MRIRFLKDRPWTNPEDRRISISFKAGHEFTIKREWGEALVAEGSVEEIDPPTREEATAEVVAPKRTRKAKV